MIEPPVRTVALCRRPRPRGSDRTGFRFPALSRRHGRGHLTRCHGWVCPCAQLLSLCSPCRSVPADNGRENRMAGFLFKLETLEGEPAQPSEFSCSVPNWRLGDTIHLGAGRCACSASATTTPTNRQCWSLRGLGGEGAENAAKSGHRGSRCGVSHFHGSHPRVHLFTRGQYRLRAPRRPVACDPFAR
jgi:hypothetical protein